MFTGSTKLPPAKTPQPERLDEVYAALRRGLQSYLQVHQLELDSLGQQIRENKRNGRLGSLYEQDKQVKAIERFMRRLEFHLSKVEELYDAYCIQRRLRDGASKMVAAFNSATGSREARESLSEANKGYRECTEHMCSLESELESQMGEFHVKMKGLAGFARLCAGDQYEVLMRYGRQRWRLRGRVEVSNKQIWDSEEYIFLPLVAELLSIKVTELKSLANHVVVGSVSCEMLDLFCPLPQTLAVDINDLGTVKLNLEVTWSPFDKDDQTSSTSTVSKRLLSNQSPPDTPSMREQVFYSLLKRQGEMENGTVWSNSSESSDDSSSPALAHHAQRLTASSMLQTTLTAQLSSTPHKSSASTPSLSSNQEEDEADGGEVFPAADAVPNGHPRTLCSLGLIGESSPDCTAADGVCVRSEELSCSCPDVCAAPPGSSREEGGVSAEEEEATEDSTAPTEATSKDGAAESAEEPQTEQSRPDQEAARAEDAPAAPFPTSISFNQEVETALESFDFLNCADSDEEDEDEDEEKEPQQPQEDEGEKEEQDVKEQEDQNPAEEEKPEETETEKPEERVKTEKTEEEEKAMEILYSGGSDEEVEEVDGLEILMEAPEGFRNSDEDCFCESQESSVADLQDLGQLEIPAAEEEEAEEEERSEAKKGDEERGAGASQDQEDCPSTPTHLATTVF
ncbi:rho family-interacting cell polarization regulator 1-like [Salarias fasciatus]|uniref:Rho family-interacting cell polarization regulator 1-like n=1 Tax=Salarias fasciatus TaxID=181472 RepID=A0A672I427_SALFA|nr:rho family-interacting cell polarization regulator 1-like [Salarias fasciatus]XP_029943168.1 rho family-interacting cell polarization regulator 1-like [Salarias fasciatus]